MLIKIDAIDNLIFRDGKPFGGEGDNWANSFKFPSLSTIYGALRSIYFANNPNEIKSKANKEDDPTKNLKINNLYFLYKDILIFPIPRDLVLVEKKKKEELILLNFEENKTTNNPLSKIFYTTEKNAKNKNGFLKKSQFNKYLQGNTGLSILDYDKVVKEEPKIGIGLNRKTKNVQDGRLYRVGFNRYKDLSIVVDFEGLEIENSGILKLGGEGKIATFQKIKDIKLPSINSINSNIFKLVLLTPAIFKNGWYPDFLNEQFEGEFEGIKLKLIAAAIDKPQYIGGWDIQNNKPKPMFKVVPAGSVYYFELKNEKDRNKIFEKFNYQSIVTIDDKYKKEGYGVVVIGDVKDEK